MMVGMHNLAASAKQNCHFRAGVALVSSQASFYLGKSVNAKSAV
jgi:hypothetical protein